MSFFPHPRSDGPTDHPRWLTSHYRMSYLLEDDDHDEIHCDYIGTGKWLANIRPRKRKNASLRIASFTKK
ncbi:hypothetical protein [Brevibacillus migulae]|uniref:hypothetical protein n=1 Tax=Brevibacillus migulae TaxID=1644114 RepID=UPI00106E52BA|nr:hypothetical protein [Brevibacillus migulae]